MLQELTIKNCQSHKKSVIEFSPGITCVIGDNNAGKTAILRALWALAFNPKGYFSKLKRHKKFWPEITGIWNGHEIIRNQKGYILDGKEYLAVGDSVPADISNILNLDEINFKLIREELFLISLPPGQRAKLINRASGLDSQEELIAYCNKQIKGCTDEIKIKEYLRNSLKRTISKLSPVLDLEEKIENLEANLETIRELELEFEYVDNNIGRLEELERMLQKGYLEGMISYRLTKLNSILGQMESVEREIVEVGYAVTRIEEIGEMDSEQEYMIELKDRLDEAERLNVELLKKLSESEDLRMRVKKLELLEDSLSKGVQSLKESLDNLAEAYRAAGKCPLCDSDLEDR